jgi:hypothetical protein
MEPALASWLPWMAFPLPRSFLCLPVENSCFWLPAVDGGKDCLGLPALLPTQFASVLGEMALCLATGSTAEREGKEEIHDRAFFS